MDSIINLMVGELTLAPEYIFVARCLALCLVVNVLTSLISVLVPMVKSMR